MAQYLCGVEGQKLIALIGLRRHSTDCSMGAGDAINGIVIEHKPGHMLLLDLTDEKALAAEKKMLL